MKTINRHILIVLFALLTHAAFAQITVNIQVKPPYQSRIAEYASRPDLILITLTNTSATEQRVQLTGSITGNNGVSLQVRPSYKSSSPIILAPGQTVPLDATAISFLFNYSSIEIKGIALNNVVHDARLPEGVYQLCIRALDYDSRQSISPEEPMGCTMFFINDTEPPTITSPQNGVIISRSTGQVFPITWSAPSASLTTQYTIRIVEIIAERNPNDAMQSAARPLILEQTVSGNSYLYGSADQAFTPGRKYAIMVQAEDPEGRTIFRNGGMSEVYTFTYEDTVITPFLAEYKNDDTTEHDDTTEYADTAEPDCGDCASEKPGGAPQNNLVKVGSKIKVGQFEMTVNSVQKNGETLRGEGIIPVTSISSAARLRVEFANIKVNSRLELIEGLVHGKISNEAAGFLPKITPPDVPTLADFGPSKAMQLTSYFQQKSDQLISSIKQSVSAAGFELPFGLSNGANTLAITSITFSPRQAWFSVVGSVKIPDSEQRFLSLTGKNFCLDATDFCKSGRIYLNEDFAITSTFKLNKPGVDIIRQPGTYVEFDKNGFKSLGIDADYSFTSVLERADNGEPLTVKIAAQTYRGWSDWIGMIQMPDFRISGMRSISFSLGDKPVYYDHSDFRKPDGIPDSFDSQGESSINTSALTWHGFYIPTIQIKLPEIIKSGTNALTVEGYNIIIDKNGFTGTVQNQGTLLALETGSLGGWYASVDKVAINIFKSGFKESSILGKIVLPGTKEHNDASNQLDYNASLTSKVGEDISYKLTVKEKDNIAYDVLFMTLKLTNCDLVVTGDFGSAPKADLTLAGEFSISNSTKSKVKVPGIKNIDLPGLKFNDLKLKTYGDFADLSNFTYSLSSPQKSLAGFEFTLKLKKPEMNGTDIAFPINGTLDFAMIPGFSFGADATVSIVSGFEMKQSGRIGIKTPKAKIEEIKMGTAVDLGAFKIRGAIKYYYNDRNASDIREGFVGALETSIVDILTVNMRAHFGSSSASGGYKYFEFNAMADLGQSGITFLPPLPLALYGFGGGFAYNMEIDRSSVPSPASVPVKDKTTDVASVPDKAKSDKDPNPGAEAMELLDFNPSGIKMTPKKGAYGLQATVLFGLTSRNTFDADATFSIAFSESGGLSNIGLVANGRVLTDVSKPLAQRRGFSTGAGSITFNYDAPAKTFTANAEMVYGVPNVDNAGLMKAGGTMSFYGGPGGWNFKFGSADPNVLNNAGVEILGFLKGKSYFQVGSYDIDNMPDIPDKIYELAGRGERNQRSELRKTQQANRTYRPGSSDSGLITGSLATLGSPDKEYTFLFFYGKLYMMTGFDLSIKPGKSCSNVSSAGGPGGWYAEGQAYMGAEAAVGINVDIFLVKGKFEIFKAGAAAFINAGLPNPFFAKGAVGGNFSILNGAVKGRFSLPFSIGEKCVDNSSDVFGGLDIISQLHPQLNPDEKVDISTSLGVVFNLESDKAFTIEDWNRVDDDGIPQTRYFLFDKSCISANLNGTPINKNYLKIADTEKLTYVYDSPEYLKKETTYTWQVLAKLKEGTVRLNPGANPIDPKNYNIIYNYVKGQQLVGGVYIPTTQDATQEKSVRLTTNKGFESIPPENYAYTTPLHSHSAVLTNSGSLMEIVTKRPVDETSLAFPEGTEYVATLYQNGSRIGGDIPVSRDVVSVSFKQPGGNVPGAMRDSEILPRSRWWFNAPTQLQPSSNYEVRIVAKVASTGQSVNTELQETTRDYSSQGYMISATVSNRVLNNRLMREIKSDYRPIVARFAFATSAYSTLEQKTNAMTIVRIENPETSEIIIGDRLTQSQNRANFERLIPAVGGKYTVRLGATLNFPVKIILGGESYNQADMETVFSDKVFMTSSAAGTGGDVQIRVMLGDIRIADYSNKLLNYLSEKTGIPRSQLSYVYSAVELPRNTGSVQWNKTGGVYSEFIGRLTNIGAVVYNNSNADAASASTSASASSSASTGSSSASVNTAQMSSSLAAYMGYASSFSIFTQSPQFAETYSQEFPKANEIGTRVVGNPIQMQINKVINPGLQAVNTAPMGAPQLWENVSAVANTGANNMNVSNLQMNQGVQNALTGRGIR